MTLSRVMVRLGELDRRATGAALAYLAAVAILVAEGRSATGGGSDLRDQDAVAFVLVALASVALLWRRRWPIPVMVVVSALAYQWWHVVGYDGRAINVAYLVALYTVALLGSSRRTATVGVVLGIASAAALVAWGQGFALQRWMTGLGWTMAALLFGETVRGRTDLAAASEERARRAEAETDRRLVEERLAIARELHDVLAHTVSAMSVQAEVAMDSLERDLQAVREALGTIRRASRDAMAEVRATVAVLRSNGHAIHGPPPGIAAVPDLVCSAREHGLLVTTDYALSGRPLPDVIGLTVYRVVQEAITNVVRHAGASCATVAIHESPDRLIVEVCDDGHGATEPVAAGFGLRGMAERVESIGGQLWHGSDHDEGGFVVRATLPVPEARR